MRNRFIAPILFGIASQIHATPTQWLANAGGNNHYYEAFAVQGGISWADANALAIAKGGYLATLTSAAENQFVFNLIDKPIYWSINPQKFGSGPWLGGMQLPGSSEPGGGWQWLNEEGAFAFTKWQPGEPNNGGPGGAPEDKLLFWSVATPSGRSQFWNDGNAGAKIPSYVVEFNASPVPEPSSGLLLSLGVMYMILRHTIIRKTGAQRFD